jgi:hypothetical protein
MAMSDGEFRELIERGSLGTPEARRLREIGHAMGKPYPAEALLDDALDALAQWLDGYTEPITGLPQRRLVVTAREEDHVDVMVKGVDAVEPDRHLRIWARVEELP